MANTTTSEVSAVETPHSLGLIPPRYCLNCGAVLAGPYCSQCGQADVEPVPRLGELLPEVVEEFFKVDAKVARTLRLLVARPGQVTVEYAAGRRAAYVAPFKLYFATSFVYYLISTLWGDDDIKNWGMKTVGLSREISETLLAGMQFFLEHAATISILLLPLNTLALALLFYGCRRPFLLHLVATLHMWSGSMLHYIPFYLLAQGAIALFDGGDYKPLLGPAYLPFMFVYLALACRRLYGASKTEAALKSIAVCAWTCFMSMAAMVVILIVFVLGSAIKDGRKTPHEPARKPAVEGPIKPGAKVPSKPRAGSIRKPSARPERTFDRGKASLLK